MRTFDVKSSRQYLIEFLTEIGLDENIVGELISVYDKAFSSELIAKRFFDLLLEYEDENLDYDKMLEEEKSIFADAKVNEFQGNAIFVAFMFSNLRSLYEKKGISDEIFIESARDLRYKILECKDVENVYGTFVPKWYGGFFKLIRFGLGRLQFHMEKLGTKYSNNGVDLNENSKVVAVHIPRSGVRLEPSLVENSFSKAIEFFKPYFENEPTVFVCNSWLLYPLNKTILKPTSNLYKFISKFDIIYSYDYENYHEAWRLFDMKIEGNEDNLPLDTSLRIEYAKRMKAKKPLGIAKGVFVAKI